MHTVKNMFCISALLSLLLLSGCSLFRQPILNAPTQPDIAKEGQPNVIIIVADQMRRASMGFWQTPAFKGGLNTVSDPVVTPNLDALAGQGVVFNQAIANYPLCSPFRGMLLSGRFPHNNGVTNNTRDDRPHLGLRTDITTLTESLALAGYNTALVGKGHWHNNLPLFNEVGEYEGTIEPPGGRFIKGTRYDTFIPEGEGRHGIQYWYQSIGHNHQHPVVYTNDRIASKGKKDGQPYYPKQYSAVNQADVIIDYVNNTHGQRDISKPFGLLWTMDPPHNPYSSLNDTDEALYNKYYKDIAIEHILNRQNVDIARAEKYARIHFSMVTLIDREIGRLMAALKEKDLHENTLIVFTSDHGEMMGSHSKMFKNTFYEEALGIPLIMYFDGKLTQQVNNLLIGVPDFMPTILGLLDLQLYTPNMLDGVDYSSLLKHGDSKAMPKPKSSLYYGPSSQLGVRTDQYLYVLNHHGGLLALFDLIQDPYQLNNLRLESLPTKDRLFLQKELGYWLDKSRHPWAADKKFTSHIIYPKRKK